MRPLPSLALAVAGALVGAPAPAAEGMWPLNLLPQAALEAHGLKPDVARLQAVSVNVGGASGSFVSPHGLVLTNHHVISECLDHLSTPARPLQSTGFVAAKPAQALRCPGLVAKVLQGIDDVTDQIPADTAGRKAAIDRLTGADCPKGEVCELVPLYGGALHHRYRHRTWNDVRLVMAPEAQAANFGGDDDNFAYPRFAFDFALLRVYEPNGQPHRPAHWLRPARHDLKLNDAVMVPGHPYVTERQKTLAQLEAERDLHTPLWIDRAAQELEALRAYAQTSPDAQRQTMDMVLNLENGLKVIRGELAALRTPALMQRLRDEESAIRRVAGSQAPWEAVAQAEAAAMRLAPLRTALQAPAGSLLGQVLQVLAVRAERHRPAEERLEGFHDREAEQQAEELGADRPVHLGVEQVRLTQYIAWMQARLGGEHPWVRTALAGQPDAAAAARHWLAGTALTDLAQRRALLTLDDDALARHPDRLVQLARALHPDLHRLRHEWETQVRQPRLAQARALAQARWQAQGRGAPPDATGTLRLSFGRVAEQDLGGLRQPWFSTVGGLWARADGFGHQAPFDLAPRLAAARPRLDDRTPLNFISTPDIVGGNSGSPILNAAGDWVGVVFDGNLDSLASAYVFDETRTRTVSVSLAAIRLALREVYPAQHLADEMGLGKSGLRQSRP